MKNFKNKLQEIYIKNINEQLDSSFRQLVNYVDSAIADSCKKDGDEKTQSLILHLMSIRDYMSKYITENSLRKVLLSEAMQIINELEAVDKTNEKKESKLKIQQEQEENISEIDQETLSEIDI